ncbi:MAG TPA: hypothetical protein VF163_16550 [Micromonosporaceae bacterium]
MPTPGTAPALTGPAPAPASAPTPAPAPAVAKPEKWAGRVAVPGAVAPGQKSAAAPPAPTRTLARVAEPRATGYPGPASYPAQAPVRRRRSGARRFFGALFAVLLILAVPVVSAYVSYKLASGENPFEWPPTVDYSHVF